MYLTWVRLNDDREVRVDQIVERYYLQPTEAIPASGSVPALAASERRKIMHVRLITGETHRVSLLCEARVTEETDRYVASFNTEFEPVLYSRRQG